MLTKPLNICIVKSERDNWTFLLIVNWWWCFGLSKDLEFKNYTLGDEAVIEYLIMMRYKYDEKMHINDNEITMMASGAYQLNKEIIATYATLDKYISKAKLSDNQKKLLDMIDYGYNNEEIAFELDINPTGVRSRLKTICKKIKRVNDWEWQKYISKDKFGLKNKKCTACLEELPATPYFFGDNNSSRDGFYSMCRMCK